MAKAHVNPEAWAKKVRRRKRILIPLGIVLVVAVVAGWVLKKSVLPELRHRHAYEQAEEAMRLGNVQEAIDQFSVLWYYKDAAARATELVASAQKDDALLQTIQNAQLGDTLCLGRWEQDGWSENGPEPIEWLVMGEDDGLLLLMSKNILDSVPFNETTEKVTWEDCTLRSWLNETFYADAFSQDEKLFVAKSVVNTADNPVSHTKGGEKTEDHVFILSFNELIVCSAANPNLEDLSAAPTRYAIDQGAEYNSEWKSAAWWIRMPGLEQSCAGYCDMTGNPLYNCPVSRKGLGVRPAIWVFSPGRHVEQEQQAG